MKNNETSWGKVAGWYDDLLEQNAGSFQKEVILPNLMRLMPNIKGQTVLDLACGQGYFSREFANAGAKVIASDISSELIKIAKGKGGPIEYHTAPADDISFMKNESADRATVILAIQNIENAQKVFVEAFRVLKKGGELHLVLNHPSFRIPKASSWGWEEVSPKNKFIQYRRIDSYMSERKIEIDMNPGSDKNKAITYSFHRPLQWFSKTLGNTGFVISRLEEWISHKESEKGGRGEEENRMRKEIPMFMYIQAKKLN